MRKGRIAIVAVGVALLGCSAGAFAFGPVVRSRVAKEAERRHLEVHVGAVRPGFFAIVLRDVEVKLDGVDGVAANFPEVRADFSAALRLHAISLHGGSLALDGDPADLADKLHAWRDASRGSASPDNASANHVEITGDALSLTWHGEHGLVADAKGIGFAKDANGTKLAMETLHASNGREEVSIADLSVDVDPQSALRAVRAASTDLALVVSENGFVDPAAASAQSSAEPAPLPVAPPIGVPRSGKNGKDAKDKRTAAVAAPAPSAPSEPLLSLPDPRKLRARLAFAQRLLAERVPAGAHVNVDAMTLALRVGTDSVTIGPGPLAISRDDTRLSASFTTDTRQPNASTPLSISADLPIGEGDASISLSGGPVSLALLGVKEGAAGLTDVSRGSIGGQGKVVLSSAGDALTFDGRVDVRGISLKQPRLAVDTIRGLDASVSARGLLTSDGELRVDDAELALGQIRLQGHGTVNATPEFVSMSVSGDVPIASCQAMIDSAPEALVPTVKSARFDGTFSAQGRLTFDSRKLDDLVLDYTIADACRLTEVPPELSRDRFMHAFAHRIYLPDGKIGEETTGPGTDNWTDIDRISPYMLVSVLTTEDGAFFRHRGFNHAAFRNALVANLKARRFVRGASTISMQLAKNLFLVRDKTLSRKFEELILTDYLEQVFTKDEMMELYLNVIEFGPKIYGVTRAAEAYFGRKPDELNLAECLYLASMMPSPLRYYHIREKGEVPDYWMKHLHTLMQIAAKNGKIDDHELDEAMSEAIVFHRDGDPPPPPRPPVAARVGNGTDDAWQPVD